MELASKLGGTKHGLSLVVREQRDLRLKKGNCPYLKHNSTSQFCMNVTILTIAHRLVMLSRPGPEEFSLARAGPKNSNGPNGLVRALVS